MPIKKCQINGKQGLKYGDSGKCYTGKDKRQKAERQRTAIKASQSRRGRGFEAAMKK